jgi:hypothetical protein
MKQTVQELISYLTQDIQNVPSKICPGGFLRRSLASHIKHSTGFDTLTDEQIQAEIDQWVKEHGG